MHSTSCNVRFIVYTLTLEAEKVLWKEIRLPKNTLKMLCPTQLVNNLLCGKMCARSHLTNW